MEEIRELVSIVLEHTKKNLPLIDLKATEDGDNKELKLFLGIKNGEFLDDTQASKGIYGTEEVDFKFRMLKSRLNRKLLNHLFFTDLAQSKLPRHVGVHQECMDYLYFAKMLMRIGEMKLASKLLYKVLDQAQELEYTDVVIDTLNELRSLYTATFRPKLYQNTKEQIIKYKDLLLVEEEANTIFFDNKLMLNSGINNRKRDLDPVKDDVEKLYQLYEDTKSYNVYVKYLKLKIWYYELSGDFESVLNFIKEVEGYKPKLNEKRFNDELLQFAKSYAFLKLRRLDDGKAYMNSIIENFEKDTSNWLSFSENYFLMATLSGDYQLAEEIFTEVANSKIFQKNEKHLSLKWNIFRSYLFFMTSNKKLIRKFDYEQFLYEVPEFNKDLAVENTLLLILSAIHKIDGDIKVLNQALDAIDDYTNKFLNNSYSKRIKIFIKLLNKVAAHDRNYDQIISKSKYLVEKLHESEVSGDEYVDYEIVPYETLWQIALEKVTAYKYASIS